MPLSVVHPSMFLTLCYALHWRVLSSPLWFVIIIIIVIIYFVQNKMDIKHMNKISEQDNKALKSALTAALSTIICLLDGSI